MSILTNYEPLRDAPKESIQKPAAGQTVTISIKNTIPFTQRHYWKNVCFWSGIVITTALAITSLYFSVMEKREADRQYYDLGCTPQNTNIECTRLNDTSVGATYLMGTAGIMFILKGLYPIYNFSPKFRKVAPILLTKVAFASGLAIFSGTYFYSLSNKAFWSSMAYSVGSAGFILHNERSVEKRIKFIWDKP